MSSFLVFLMGMLAALIQSALLGGLLPGVFVPDLILLLVVYTSLLFPLPRGLVLSFALGMLADLFSGAPEGLNTLFAISLYALSRGIQARIFIGGARIGWGLVLLAFLLKAPCLYVCSALFGLRLPGPDSAIPIWLGECLASLLVTPAVFYVVSRSLGFPGWTFLRHRRSRAA